MKTTQLLAHEVAHTFETIAPLDSGVAGDELGFVFGSPETAVTGVGCMWSVQGNSLKACIQQGLNMIVCHEGLWLPAQTSPWYDGPEEQEIFSNILRKQLLNEQNMVVYRSHSNWDALPKDGVPDQAVAALQLKGLKRVAQQKFFSVHELETPMTMSDLLAVTEKGLGFAGCRLFGDAAKPIHRFAVLIGGFGENQWHMPQAARDMGAEAVLIGEMSEFLVIACLEMGLPVIETLHSVSEIPAIKRQADILKRLFPEVPVQYVPSGICSYGNPDLL